MTTRRRVVVLPQVFDRLDDLLPQERSPSGRPSAADFVLHDLTAMIDPLADDFERSTAAIPGSSIRVLVASGITVSYFAVYARLERDTVEVYSISIDEQ